MKKKKTEKVDYGKYLSQSEKLNDFSFAGGGPPPPPVPRDPIEEPVGIDTDEYPRPTDREKQGKPPGALSLTVQEVIDLISEGEIEGLVSGDYVYKSEIGATGYESCKFEPYVPISAGSSIASPKSYLRSVLYNDLEVLNTQGNYNYQGVDFAFTEGNPRGEAIVLTEDDQEAGFESLQVIRPISEKLYGPETQYIDDSYEPTEIELKDNEDSLGRDQSKFYKVLNNKCIKFKIIVNVQQLQKRELSGPYKYREGHAQPKIGKGDQKGYTVEYRIDYRPYFSKDHKNEEFFVRNDEGIITSQNVENVVKEVVYGRVSAGYLRETTVTIDPDKYGQTMEDPDFLGWHIAVYRSTFDSFSSSIQAATQIDSIIEIYDEKYAYPNSAYIRSKFRADNFSKLPKRTFKTRGIKVRVPNNYNTILKTYGAVRGGTAITDGGDAALNTPYDSDGNPGAVTTEDWNGDWKRNSDGTIKYEWTDNPAWVFYDLVTNPRYGLGDKIRPKNIDKWGLFEIAKYCDVLVPNGEANDDGSGEAGEPRFTCNASITTRSEALEVVNSFASIFRGLAFYKAGKLQVTSDKQQSTSYVFNNSNVENGEFHYSSSAKKARATVVLVRFNDKKDNYKPTIEYVEDAEGIKSLGIQFRELTAFGCTSKSQATRFGKYVLFTESLETQTTNFMAGAEGNYISPGMVVGISDKNRGNYGDFFKNRRGGRSTRFDIVSGEGIGDGHLQTGYLYLDSTISGYVNNSQVATNDEYDFKILTGPSYVDPLRTNITSSEAASQYIKRPAVQTFKIKKADVIETGTAYSGIEQRGTNSVVLIKGDATSSTNVVDTINYNVTGFTGLLYDPNGNQISNTGFTEDKPDSFTWAIDFTGQALNITPDFERYRVVAVKEKQRNKFSISAIEYVESKYDLIDFSTQNIAPAALGLPNHPSSLLLISQNVTPNAKKVDYSFREPTDTTALNGYKVYVKKGSDFSSPSDFTDDPYSSLPNNEYLTDFIPRGKSAESYLPFEDDTYYFRIYGVNSYGRGEAAGFASNNITVNGINLLMDLEINSLSLVGDVEQANEAGKPDGSSDYTTAAIEFGWQAGFTNPNLEPFAVPTNFKFRVSYRSPDQYNPIPSNPIYTETTGISSSKFTDDLTISENMEINSSAPYRNMDIVVEAVDSAGRSSAGGSITRDGAGNVLTDATYSNSKGYDILYVNNEAPQSVRVSDRIGTNGASAENCDNEVNANFCTDQWLEDDGTLDFVIERDTNGIITGVSDISQAVFMVSKDYFDPTTIDSKIDTFISSPTDQITPVTQIDDAPTYVIASEGLSSNEDYVFSVKTPFTSITSPDDIVDDDVIGKGLTHIFLNVGFIDHFASSAVEQKPTRKSLLKKINWSTNTIKVGPRNAFLLGSLMYRAWIILNVNWDSEDILDYHSANMEEIAYVDHAANYTVRQQKVTHGKGGSTTYRNFNVVANRAARSFTFRDPLPSSRYEVVIHYSPNERALVSLQHPVMGGGANHLAVTSKTRYGFTVASAGTGGYGQGGRPLKGCYFIGILLGTNIITNNAGLGTSNADATWLSDEYPYNVDRPDSARPIVLDTDIGSFNLNF